MGFLICIIAFAVFYAIKGGSGPYFFAQWKNVRDKHWIFDRLLDGKVLSTLMVLIFTAICTHDVLFSMLFAAAWLLTVAPSMGEEHGAVGTSRHAWGDYIDYSQSFGRIYGVKKAIQRGVWIGAIMTLVTGYIPFICFSFLFVPCVFIGQEIYYRATGRDSWVLSEPIIGAVVYGIPFSLWVMGA